MNNRLHLKKAVRTGDFKEVKCLLLMGQDVNDIAPEDLEALKEADTRGNYKFADYSAHRDKSTVESSIHYDLIDLSKKDGVQYKREVPFGSYEKIKNLVNEFKQLQLQPACVNLYSIKLDDIEKIFEIPRLLISKFKRDVVSNDLKIYFNAKISLSYLQEAQYILQQKGIDSRIENKKNDRMFAETPILIIPSQQLNKFLQFIDQSLTAKQSQCVYKFIPRIDVD